MAYTLLLVAGVYVDIGAALTGVPMLSALPAVIIGLMIFIRRLFTMETLYAICIAIAVYIWSLLAPSESQYFWARTLAFGQFCYSLLVGLIMFWTVTRYDRRAIIRFLNAALTAYIVLLALEVFTPFANLVDMYMNHAFGQNEAGQAIVNGRDMGIGFGFRRPKMFASETSYVAMWFTFALGVKAFLDTSRRSFIPNLLIGLAGFALIRSPISAVGLIFVCAAISLHLTRRADIGLRVATILLFALISFAMLLFLQNVVFADRLAAAKSGADYSTTYRTYGSLFAAAEIARENPIFGVGIGSIDLAYAPITDTYLRLGVPPASVYAEWRSQIQNLPASLLAYLGWVGSIVVSIVVLIYWRMIAGRLRYFFWALLAILAASYAAFYSPKFEAFAYLSLAINAVHNREERQERDAARERRAAAEAGDADALPASGFGMGAAMSSEPTA